MENSVRSIMIKDGHKKCTSTPLYTSQTKGESQVKKSRGSRFWVTISLSNFVGLPYRILLKTPARELGVYKGTRRTGR